MFRIGEFSRISQITVKALHHYETIKLLVPDTIDPCTNYRFYSGNQLETVNKIKFFKQLGLPLKSIKIILTSENTNVLEEYYELQVQDIEFELNQLHIKKDLLKEYQLKMREGKNMEKYNVSLKEEKQRSVMSIRKVVPSFNDEGVLWSELYEASRNLNVQLTNPPTGLSFYHDKEYRDTDIEIEVQSNVVGDYEDVGSVKFFTAPAYVMASITFNGSYDQMHEVTQALATWIEVNDYKITGPMVNIAHVSSVQDPNPDNWITESGFIVSK